ncbi:MAG: CHAT domain-containing protein [Caldilineales bacterium]|nr:CHAT domain-containing protein [Caldilineales bacterium]
MNLQRILFIAPDSELGAAQEIEPLYDYGYQVQAVQGRVTRQRLFDIVRRNEYDIIHFVAHGSHENVQLSGDLLDASGLVQLVRAAKAQLVFLNSCASAMLGQILIDEEAAAAVIVTLDVIADNVARETAQVFYRELARTNDIRQAFVASKPPVRGGYVLLHNGRLDELRFAPILARLDHLQELLTNNNEEHERFRKIIVDITMDMGALHESVLTGERLKRWFLAVLVAFTSGTLLLEALFVLLVVRR